MLLQRRNGATNGGGLEFLPRDPFRPRSSVRQRGRTRSGCGVALGLLLAHGDSGALEVDQGRGVNRLGLGVRAARLRPARGGRWVRGPLVSGWGEGSIGRGSGASVRAYRFARFSGLRAVGFGGPQRCGGLGRAVRG